MTIAEQIANLKLAIASLSDGKALEKAANSVHTDRVERIFDKGTVARGYSTKPIWIANKNMRGAQNKGKSGRATKTSYFAGGYKEYHGAIGFDPSYVNFRNTNDLQSDFSNGRVTTKRNNFLFVEEIRRDGNVDKLKGNQKRFGPFLNFTNDEVRKFDEILQLELTKVLRGEQ